MNYLSQNKIENKRVLLRCDFNVPIVDGKITDNSKIMKSLKTINYLLDNGNTVIIFSHFGRVKTIDDKINNSLFNVYLELKKYLEIAFIKDPLNIDEINNLSSKCFLVENTRFTDVPVQTESKNDLKLAEYWSSFGDVFVIDAFASLHRLHSSTAGIAKFLPTYLGFLVEDEIKNLEPLINISKHPFTVIMGGAKVQDKIVIIDKMLEKCDYLILTGGILNTFLKVIGKNVGSSNVTDDENILEYVRKVYEKYHDKIRYSDNFLVLRNNEIINCRIDDIKDNDFIYDNIIDEQIINDSALIFFNGTTGKFECPQYEKGTKTILSHLKNSPAQVIIGGGDTVSSVIKFGYQNDFSYLSSGGGATLDYVSNGCLKALEYIENCSSKK